MSAVETGKIHAGVGRTENLLPESRQILEEDPNEERVVLLDGKRVQRASLLEKPVDSNGPKPLELKSFTSYLHVFADEFVDRGLLKPRLYNIASSACPNCCMRINGNNGNPAWRTDTCDKNHADFKFYWFYGNGLRNQGTSKCVDAAFPQRGGHLPIAYACMKVNRNQEWQILNNKIMWGSWCMETNEDENNRFLKMERCVAHNPRQEFKITELPS